VESDGPPLRSDDSPIVLRKGEYDQMIFHAPEGRTVVSPVGHATILLL
jgi:hypothetical protein